MLTRELWLFVLVLGLLLSVVQSPLIAQSSDSTSLHEGSWALQFGIAGNFTLTSFQGASISTKYHLTDRTAVRGGITISSNTNDGNNSTSSVVNDTSNGTAA